MGPLEKKLHELKLVMDETVTFPTEYQFKFIVPVSEVHQIMFILQGMELSQHPSSTGKYISVNAKHVMNTSDEIILIYQRAAVIKGIISL